MKPQYLQCNRDSDNDPRNIEFVPCLRLRERDLRGWFEMSSNWMNVLAERMARRDVPVPQTLQPEYGERRPHMGYTFPFDIGILYRPCP
jgi:hypothetical protein